MMFQLIQPVSPMRSNFLGMSRPQFERSASGPIVFPYAAQFKKIRFIVGQSRPYLVEEKHMEDVAHGKTS